MVGRKFPTNPKLHDTLADAAQTEDRQGLAVQVATQALLPLARPQGVASATRLRVACYSLTAQADIGAGHQWAG